MWAEICSNRRRSGTGPDIEERLDFWEVALLDGEMRLSFLSDSCQRNAQTAAPFLSPSVFMVGIG
jgi:hypothetical protein